MSKIAELIAGGVHVLPDRAAANVDEAFAPEDALDRVTSARLTLGEGIEGGPVPALAIGHAVSPDKAVAGGLESLIEAGRSTFVLIFVKYGDSAAYQLADCVGRVDEEGMTACVAYLKQQFGEEVEMPTLANA